MSAQKAKKFNVAGVDIDLTVPDGEIGTSKLADKAVTKAKLADEVTQDIEGRIPMPQGGTAGQVLTKANDGVEWAPPISHLYLSLERLRQYLYRVTFDSLPEDTGDSIPVAGACSSFVRDGKLHRNLDFLYDNAASFIVRTRDFEGMSFMTGLNDGAMDDEKVAQLPFRMVDGRNNHGIMVAVHVLFNDWEYSGAGDKSIPLTKLPYLILSKVKSMASIATDLSDVLGNLAVTEGMGEYLLQCLVTDGTTTYAVIPPTSDNQSYVLVDATSCPKMTNFRYVARDEVSRHDMDMQTRPTGIERWNMMPCDLDDLRFTLAYESADRLTEFIGIDGTTKASTDAELTEIYDLARAEYLSRERDGKTWQTMHSVVYGAKMEELYIQENWAENVIASGGTSDHAELTNRDAEDQHPMSAITGLLEALGGKMDVAIPITHDALVALRDNGGLAPGQLYRITDYQRYGNRFDVIVTADSESVLNENARAANHDGDEYFTNSKLDAWELKYCLDNDDERFAWSVSSDKGVIYYMKDEWGNEAPFDFKNVKFRRSIPGLGETVCFCFSIFTPNRLYDASIAGNTEEFIDDDDHVPGVAGNIIEPRYDNGLFLLPDVVFVRYVEEEFKGFNGNKIGRDCNVVTLRNGCHDNVIGAGCERVTLAAGECGLHVDAGVTDAELTGIPANSWVGKRNVTLIVRDIFEEQEYLTNAEIDAMFNTEDDS